MLLIIVILGYLVMGVKSCGFGGDLDVCLEVVSVIKLVGGSNCVNFDFVDMGLISIVN